MVDAEAARWMLIGRVARDFGLRGEVKVEVLTDFPDRFAGLKEVYLGPGRVPFRIESSRRHQAHVLMKFSGVDTPEQARDLRGQDLSVPREDAVPLPPGHYYLDDLLGMTVLTPEGETVGRIADVLRTGSNDVYVVNEGRHAILVPAIRDAVRELDLEGRRVVIERWVLEAPE